ncbi:MAG TPA: lysophospholipid acyltransferase family protein, partial [Cyclobacteriaceae bacterium]|nr:lysophospholipid acyltransferase family protein [Cyclobacteriaceae bacterium]
MLYKFFKWIVRLTLHSYFRKIVITGYHNIPSNGPVIFVANHPSAFMDPMVVGSTIDSSIHFLAAAEFFGKGIKSWFYQKQLNMIPVFRPTTLPGETYKNEEVFSKCFELLGRGGSILVFPEGNSVTEKRIRKLKTGVARMALGTTEFTKGAVHVVVVPIGLNYTNPHRFQSEVFVKIGQPISTHQFTSDNSQVVKLTEEIEAGLKQTVLHIQTEELDSVVKKIEVIMKPEFQGGISHRKKNEFLFHQKVIQSIEEISKKEPLQISALETKLDLYLNKIRSLGISDGSLARLSTFVSLVELVRLMLAFPLFLFGYLINSIPYQSTVWYFRSLKIFSHEGFE